MGKLLCWMGFHSYVEFKVRWNEYFNLIESRCDRCSKHEGK